VILVPYASEYGKDVAMAGDIWKKIYDYLPYKA
jgi:hypothetical protein